MTFIYLQAIRESLQELSNLELQKELWFSDGSNGKDVSSFDEAVEGLFTDTGLSDLLLKGQTGLGEEADTILRLMQSLLPKIDVSHGPKRTIDDPHMIEIRALAGRLLSLLA